MRNTVRKHEDNRKVKRNTVRAVTLFGSLAVAFLVIWGLMAPGIAMEKKTYCGLEAHTHSEACYTEKLVCKKEETDGHQHTDACYKTEKVLTCGQEESEEHRHSDACYKEEKKLVCDKKEEKAHHHSADCYEKTLICGREEHVHTDACYNDPAAGTEEADAKVDTKTDTDAKQNVNAQAGEGTATNTDTYTASDDASAQSLDKLDITEDEHTVVTVNKTEANVGDIISGNIKFLLDLSKNDIDENTIIEYQLPDGLTFSEEMTDKFSGNVTGTYTLTTDGKIQIKISRESLDEHAGGTLEGGIKFEATLSKYPDNGIIEFPGNNINLQVKRDISVQKSVRQNNADGTLHYTIKVSTNAGTPDKVTIHDIVELNGSSTAYEYTNITVKDKDGKEIPVSGSFPLELDRLEANGTYTIDYDMNVTDHELIASGFKITNKAKATSGTGENTIESDASIRETTVAGATVQKSGWYDKTNGEIVWTVTISNPGKTDLSQKGSLTDTPGQNAGTYKEGSLEVKDAQGNIITGAVTITDTGFQYAFPEGSTSTEYTMTYRTSVPEDTEGDAKNKVNFNGGETDGTVNTGQLADWNVEKKYNRNEGLQEVDEHTKKLKWDVSLQFSEKEKATNLVYTDSIRDVVDASGTSYMNTHYTTIEELERSIGDNLKIFQKNDWAGKKLSELTDVYTVNIVYYSDEERQTQITDTTDKTAKVKSFELTITRKDGKQITGRAVGFTYYTFTDTSELNGQEQWNIRNTGWFHDKSSSSEYEYEKEQTTAFVKERVTVYDWNSANVAKATGDVDLGHTNGELYYRIAIKATDTQLPCTITDTLGNGMKIKTDENGNPDCIVAFYDPTTGGYSRSGNPEQYVSFEKVSSDGESEQWRFKINDYHSGNYVHDGIEIIYKVDITDHDVWKNAVTEETQAQDSVQYAHVFTNKATWEDREQNTDTKVYRTVKDFEKEGDYVTTGNDAYMPKYRVVINANGKDLNAEGDTISLSDTLTINDYANATYSYLNLSEVKLYYYDNITGEKGEEIDPSRYTVTYDQTARKLTVVVPDQLPCVLEYKYGLDSAFEHQIGLSNSVVLSGKTVAWKYMNVQESSGYIRGVSFKVQKIDSDQNAKPLSGAQFKLYYYDTGTKKFVQITDDAHDGIYETGSDGMLNLTRALYPNNVGRTDVLLMLVETKAPDGYALNSEPSYFVLEKNKKINAVYNEVDTTYRTDVWALDDQAEQSFSKIEESNITAFSQYGGVLYVRNTSGQITVKKVWTDPEGKELSNPPENITFTLHKTTTDTAKLKLIISPWTGNRTPVGEYTVKKGGEVTLTFDTLDWQKTSEISATLDGRHVTVEKTAKDKDAYSYKITFRIPENKKEHELLLDANGQGGSGFPAKDAYYLSVKDNPEGEQTTQEKITLTAADNWTYTAEAEEGAVYTVSEVKVNGKPLDDSGYTVSYYNNGGIDHGEIVITNKQKEKVYELPSTGGAGTTGYLAGGAALMCLAVLLYGYQLRQKRERGTR